MSRLARASRLTALAAAGAFALSTSVAVAQDHAPAAGHNAPTGAAATGHEATTGAPAGGHAERSEHGTAPEGQSGEHRAATGHEAGAHGGHHGPEAINFTDIFDKKRPALLALVINFGALLTLYYLLGKKPVTDALKQRRITIGKDIDDAQKMLDEANERAEKYQADLKNADAHAATAKAGLVSAGKGEVDRLVSEAQERADRMKRDAERLVEQEKKQVHQDLLRETVDAAVSEATQVLTKNVTADDHARLAQDLLAELSRAPGAGRSSFAPPAASRAPGATGGAS